VAGATLPVRFPVSHSSLASTKKSRNSFPCHTYENHARKSFACHTSKKRACKSFSCHTFSNFKCAVPSPAGFAGCMLYLPPGVNKIRALGVALRRGFLLPRSLFPNRCFRKSFIICSYRKWEGGARGCTALELWRMRGSVRGYRRTSTLTRVVPWGMKLRAWAAA
jgi:hypothetical protein